MDVTIHARHTSVPESIRNQAALRLRRLQRLDRRLDAATVVFDVQNGTRQVEVRATPQGGKPMLAHGTGGTFRTALQQGIDRIERQLKRQRERRLGRRKRANVRVANDL